MRLDPINSQTRQDRDQGPGLLACAGIENAGRIAALPPLLGKPIQIAWAPALRATCGRLRMGGGRGKEVYAASFIRERRIVFDESLQSDAGEMSRILIHEIFHFAWVRFSNASRRSWMRILTHEFARGARGELGWSAESRKTALRAFPSAHSKKTWNEYACESFCDTAAWIYALALEHDEISLARRYRELRRVWFHSMQSHRADGILI